MKKARNRENPGCLPDDPGERLNGIQEVEGSIPFVSTRKKARTAEKLYEPSAYERAKEKRERISKGGKYTIVYLLKIWEILV